MDCIDKNNTKKRLILEGSESLELDTECLHELCAHWILNLSIGGN